MCGINGVFNYDSVNTVEKRVKSMNDLTDHRGPDCSNIYRDENICFGHNRLAIIDLDEKSNQPFKSNDGNIILVYNGEIYNFKELKKELSNNYKFKTQSDTEVVVAAFKEWGIGMLERFNGMFSFALWDKESEKFYLCRDRLGIKPLYYSENNQSIVFSSSVKAINFHNKNQLIINQEDMVDYLTFGTVHSPNSFIDDIKSIPRASYLLADKDETKLIEYWSFFNSKIPKKHSDKNPHNVIKEILKNSVEKRMMSDVPFGVFLSGGIDSSILVSAASKVKSDPINTFSVVFKDEDYDERKYSRIITEKFKTNHSEIEILPDELLHNIEEPFKFMDHPSVDGINTYLIAKAVSDKGFKMAISGAGSDELFSGYPVFKNAWELNNKKWLFSFPPIIRKIAGQALVKYQASDKSKKINEILNLKLLDLNHFYPTFRKIFYSSDLKKLSKQKLNVNSLYPQQWALNELSFKKRGYSFSFLNKVSALEIETYLQNVLLRDADQMGMASSLEVRVPFLDHRLVEYVLSLSDDLKYPNYPKQLLIDSTKGWIPDEIIHRKKMGFVFPWETWIKNELRNFCQNSLDSLENTSLFNMKYVHSIWNSFLNGDNSVHWLQIWNLVVFGKWYSINDINKTK